MVFRRLLGGFKLRRDLGTLREMLFLSSVLGN